MTTLWAGHRLLAGFGDAESSTPGDFVEFSILWDGDPASMPGWDQPNFAAEFHMPGSNVNVIQLLGLGPLTRSFTVLCENATAYEYLAGLQQTTGTLRVPAAMNRLKVATEVDYFGAMVADIPDVTLTGLTGELDWTDGPVTALASFWRSSRT